MLKGILLDAGFTGVESINETTFRVNEISGMVALMSGIYHHVSCRQGYTVKHGPYYVSKGYMLKVTPSKQEVEVLPIAQAEVFEIYRLKNKLSKASYNEVIADTGIHPLNYEWCHAEELQECGTLESYILSAIMCRIDKDTIEFGKMETSDVIVIHHKGKSSAWFYDNGKFIDASEDWFCSMEQIVVRFGDIIIKTHERMDFDEQNIDYTIYNQLMHEIDDGVYDNSTIFNALMDIVEDTRRSTMYDASSFPLTYLANSRYEELIA